jgi:hypothetical protein
MVGDAFCLRLRLHTPLILPRATPRLDVLLAEAVRNLRLDWATPIQTSDIPLVWDTKLGGLRGSQLVFGTTPRSGLVAESVAFPTAIRRLPFSEVSPPIRKRITVDGGPTAPRLSEHPALLAPYALFYGVGDAMRCAELLTLLTGIGREHAHGCGEFSVGNCLAHAAWSSSSRRMKAGTSPANSCSSAVCAARPCLTAVERKLRIRQKISAPSQERKQPEIFC